MKPLRRPKPRRLVRSRRKGDRLVSPNGLPNVIVDRSSVWGNPHRDDQAAERFASDVRRVLQPQPLNPFEVGDRAIIETWKDHGGVERLYFICLQAPLQLRGVNVVCWCGKRKRCHGDTLLRLADGSLQKSVLRANPRHEGGAGGPEADGFDKYDPRQRVPLDHRSSGTKPRTDRVAVLWPRSDQPGLPLVHHPREKDQGPGVTPLIKDH